LPLVGRHLQLQSGSTFPNTYLPNFLIKLTYYFERPSKDSKLGVTYQLYHLPKTLTEWQKWPGHAHGRSKITLGRERSKDFPQILEATIGGRKSRPKGGRAKCGGIQLIFTIRKKWPAERRYRSDWKTRNSRDIGQHTGRRVRRWSYSIISLYIIKIYYIIIYNGTTVVYTVRRWPKRRYVAHYSNIIILTIMLQMPTAFSTVTCCTGL